MLVSPLASSTTPADHLHRPGAVGALGGQAPVVGRGARPSSSPPTQQRHGGLDVVPRVGVPAGTTGSRRRAPASRAIDAAVGRDVVPRRAARSIAGISALMPASRLAQVEHQALADQRVERPLGEPGGQRLLHDVPDQQLVVRLHGSGWSSLSTPTAHLSHQYGACSPCAWSRAVVRRGRPPRASPTSSSPRVDADVAALDLVVGVGQRPADLLGSQRGTVTAIVPPGRSTRTSSAIAAVSSGMCSSTSEATTRSNSPSANGSDERVALLDVGLGARRAPRPPRASRRTGRARRRARRRPGRRRPRRAPRR